MDYKILYSEAFPIVELEFEEGEYIKAESGSMIAMSSNMRVEGKMEGGVLGGLVRKVLTNESFFLQKLVATKGKGNAIIAHGLPGGIMAIQMNGKKGLIVQKGGFLAATEDIEINTKVQGLFKGLFSKEGFFLIKLEAKGTVFISSYGSIHPIKLESGEEKIIDNGHVVAWEDSMEYSIEKAGKGIMSTVTSGEGLVCRFRGPGTVYIQTRNPEIFTNWVKSFTVAPQISVPEVKE